MMEFKVYSRRWGHLDNYQIRKTSKGWWIGFSSRTGDCNKEGKPFLFENFEHDSINYPVDLGGYLEFLWQKADEGNWTEKKIQPKLNVLARWFRQQSITVQKLVF